MKIAIVGAGISGLTLANELAGIGEITVFEKSRGVGGRMATRRAGDFRFDHGAQCFTARTTRFRQFVLPLMEAGHIAVWEGRVVNLNGGEDQSDRVWFETHLVASPDMNSLCKLMAENADIRLDTEIAPLERRPDGRWHLHDKEGGDQGSFDWVISTAPPAQTARLFGIHAGFSNQIMAQKTQPCFAVMAGWNCDIDPGWAAAKVRDNPIKWISVNSSKPGRDSAKTTLVVHSRKSWTRDHIGDDLDAVQSALGDALEALTGISIKTADHVATHRWRYALVEDAQRHGPYFAGDVRLAATSDWAASSRIEEAWLCALDLASMIKTRL